MEIRAKRDPITRLMARRFLNILGLSKECNLSYPTVHGVLIKGKNISIESAKIICEYFNVGFDEIFELVEKSNEPKSNN